MIFFIACTTICVWPTLRLSTASLQEKLSLGLNPFLRQNIFKITRVCQRDGRLRFDLVVASLFSIAILNRLNSFKGIFGYCKLHVSFRARRARTALASQAPLFHSSVSGAHVSGNSSAKSCLTLNVNSLNNKRDEVEHLLISYNAVVVALQETMSPSWTFGPRLSGYVCFGSRADFKVPGARGVCLAVRKGVSCMEVLCSSFICVVKVAIDSVQFFFCSIYIPCDAPNTSHSRSVALKQLISLIKHFASAPLVIFGDFNMNVEQIKKFVDQFSLQVARMEIQGYTYSAVHQTTIDHILLSESAINFFSNAQVDHACSVSDHFPIIAQIASPTQSAQSPVDVPKFVPLRLDYQRVRAVRSKFVNHASFAQILQSFSDISPVSLDSLSPLYSAFIQAIKDICSELSLYKPPATSTHTLPPKAIALMQEKRNLARMLHFLRSVMIDASSSAYYQNLSAKLIQVSRMGTSLLNAIRRRRWLDHISQVVSQAGANKGKIFALVRSLTGRGNAKLSMSPVQDANGALVSSPAEILRVWELHFGKLFSPTQADAHADSDQPPSPIPPQQQQQQQHHHHQHQQQQHQQQLQQQLQQHQHQQHQQQHQHLQYQHQPQQHQQQPQLQPHFSQHLHDDHLQRLGSLLQQLPELSQQYPLIWGQSSVDPTLFDPLSVPTSWSEFRAALKLLKNGKAPGPSAIPTELLKTSLEPDGSDAAGPANAFARIVFVLVSSAIDFALIPAEMAASFVIPVPKKHFGSTLTSDYRPISLMDSILKIACHILKNRLTPVLPHVVSLEQAGFRRGEESGAQVAALREIVARRCFARGKAASKPTFLAFLDFAQAFDSIPHPLLLQRLACVGISGRFLQFVSALYSASTVIPRIGNSCANPVPLLRGVRQGCPLSPLLFNICIDAISNMMRPFGIPLTPRRRVGSLLFADDIVLLSDSYEELCFQITDVSVWCQVTSMSLNVNKCAVTCVSRSGKCTMIPPFKSIFGVIPSTTSYKYLGIPFAGVDADSSKQITEARLQKLNAAYHSLLPALHMRDLPASSRISLVKAFLVPVAMFGLEFIGTRCQTALKPIDAIIGKALHTVVGGSKHAKCSASVLRKEFNLPPIHASALGSRARMFLKFSSSKTAISFLYGDFESIPQTWMKMTANYLATKALLNSNDRPRDVARQLKDITWTAQEQSDKSTSMKWYSSNSFGSTATKLRIGLDRALTVGFTALIQMRSNSFLTVPRLAHFVPSLINSHSSCPCCSESVCESIEHILLECSAWSAERAKFITPALSAFCRFGVTLKDDADKVQALLGGSIGAKFWTHKVQRVPIAAQVIKFFAAIVPPRRVVLFPP